MKKPLILIVDDTPRNIQLLGAILNRADYEISVAPGGMHALRQLDSIQPDLILLDIMMPDIDGYDVCKRIKENPRLRDIPIIFLTGKSETDDVVKAFSMGASYYVTKPYRGAELLARVRLQLQLKQSQDQLKASHDELARLNRNKDHFLSIISHDLRSPFQGLLGLSGLLKTELEELTSSELRNVVEILDSSLQGVYKLVENLLSWTLIEMGKFKLYPVELSAKDIMRQQAALFEIQLKDKNINVSIELDSNINLVTDEQALSTILRNLISNAIKFTPQRGNITLSAKRNGESSVEFTVSDNGKGIEQELIDKLTRKKEERLESNVGTENERGSGLGLVLCRELIHLLGGDLKISGERGVGSVFTFNIPPLADQQ